MSVVILGGNECMVRKYKDLCRSYQCTANVISKMGGTLKNRLGSPRPAGDVHRHHLPQNGPERAE